MAHYWKNEQDRKEFFAKLRMGETNMPIDRRTPREIAESLATYYDPAPLPFDDVEAPTTFLERLEAYEPKSYLMRYILLDSAGINAAYVRRQAVNLEFQENKDMDWSYWKLFVARAANTSWNKIAPEIYEGIV